MNEELKIIIKAVTDEAKKQLDGVKKELKGIENEGKKSGKSVGEAMAAIKKGAVAAVAAISAMVVALVKLGQASDEFRKAQAKVNTSFQSMGSNAQQASKTFGELFRFLGDTDTAAEAAQSLALITTNEKDLAQWTNILQGVYASMGDKLPIEGLAEAANETLRVGQVTGVLADALNWLGVSEDAFNEQLAQTASYEEREVLLRNTLNTLYSTSAALYEKNNGAAIRLNESQYRLNVALANAAAYTLPLRAELNNLSASLLTLFAPAIQTVSIYLTAFIQIIVEAIKWVGSFFGLFSAGSEKTTADLAGYRAAVNSYMDSVSGGFDAATTSGQDTLDTIKEIKKQTMGFDELNVVSSPASTSTGGAGGGGTGGGIGGGGVGALPNPEDFGIGGLGAMEDMSKSIEKAKENIKALIPYIVAIGAAFGLIKLGKFIADVTALTKGFINLKKYGRVFDADWYGDAVRAEEVLGKIKTAVTKMAGIALLVGGIVLLVQGIKDLVQNGYSMEAVLKTLAGAIMVVVGAILLFNASLLANPITWIVIGVMAAVAAFVILWNECEGFRNFWIGLWEGIKTVFNAFVESIQPLIDAIVNAFKEAWELIKVIWNNWLVPMFKAAWEAIKVIWSGVKPYFETIWNNIKIVFSVVKDVLGSYFKLAWEYIKAVWDVVVAYFAAIWNTIAGIFSVVKNVLSGNWKGAWEAIKGIVDGWGKYFETVWNSIKKIFSAVKTFFKEVFSSAWSGIKAIFANVGSFFTGVWNTIKNIFSKVGSTIGGAVSKAFASAINWVLEKAIGIINGFISAINAAIGIINKIPGVDIKKLKKLDVPQLAQGGIVDSATLAVIGERGKEAVMPLENNTGWMDMLADRLAERTNTPSKIVLMLDGKALGEASINSINNITRQTGKLQLNLV